LFALSKNNTETFVPVLANRHNDVVMIDASKLGIDDKSGKTKKKLLTNDDVEKIVNTFTKREKIDEFSADVTYDEIIQHKYSLSPGQYFDIKIEY
ncbi:N-6 DNA methylase, partial [Mycoplasmopsis bovis]|uniref:N-6 DNA methylase n=1 Tax=Mycoplasmopsis bovis TaxID=28903 RepID=UPI003D2E8922